MADCMLFPEKWEDFIADYSFVDSDHVYTNGAELISVLRVKQLIEHMQSQQPDIVRCKDCKHRYDNDEKCPYCNECGRLEYPPDDWFCADGERKEGR